MRSSATTTGSSLQANPELFGVVLGLKPHPKELELKEVHDERLSGANQYMPVACCPWFEEDQGCEESQG